MAFTFPNMGWAPMGALNCEAVHGERPGGMVLI